MTSELKPCFSCNGSARLLKRSFYANKQSRLKSYRERVECSICGLTTREYKKPTAAVHSWNTRAVPDVPELARYRIWFDNNYNEIVDEEPDGEYVRYDQAAEMIAARDIVIEKIAELQKMAFRRAEAAEAELEQIKAQEPVGHVIYNEDVTGITAQIYEEDEIEVGAPLYAAPIDQTAEIERLRRALCEVHTMIEYDRTGKLKSAKNVINAALSGKEPS